jgi:hypothetical protein
MAVAYHGVAQVFYSTEDAAPYRGIVPITALRGIALPSLES